MKLLLSVFIMFFQSVVFSQNTSGNNYTLKHVPGISVSVFSREEFKNDSASYNRLKSRHTAINNNIKTQLDNLKKELKKDAFETTEQFNERIKKNENEIVSKNSTELNDIDDDIRSMVNKLYRFGSMDSMNILLDSTRYNADAGKWKATILINRSFQNVDLTLNPTEAKTLWTQRRSIEVNSIKSIYNDDPEFIEIRFGNMKENTILLSPENKRVFSTETSNNDNENKIFEKVEIDAEFPGGTSGWTRFITREIERNIDTLQDAGQSGTAVILFVVDKDGYVSGVRALTCTEAGVGNCLPPNSLLAKIATNAILNGPKWKPAIQNGRAVKAYRRQPVTFQLAE